ncbi:MAG TPA: hypothetical protein VFE51_16820, partial [Verrucomicrobiae bacterium]|nr:hypothetical protein [Verrucomicrobiae bacterium]
YIASDLQKSACRGVSASPVPQAIELKVLPVGDIASPNLAITALEAEAHAGTRPHVSVASFSDEDTAAARFELDVDGKPVSSQDLHLKAGAVTNLDLALPGLKPGWHDLKALLRVKDALDADNVRYACLWVPEPARVLVVEPRSDGHVFEQETFFLTSALDPTANSTNSVPGPFKMTQIRPEQLAGQLALAKGDPAWNVVILPALKDLPSGLGTALSTFVKAGGGLVLFLGEGVIANRYNGELSELLPARIGNAESIPEAASPWRIALYDTNCLAFAAFRLPNSGDLRIPQFTQRYGLELAEHSTRLAFFEDGVPLVMARTVGRGKVVLVNTSADTTWNDWPKHKTFVPFVHGVAKYAAQSSEHSSVETSDNFVCGEEFDLETGPQARLGQFILNLPGGKQARLTADDHGRIHDPHMSEPGIYSLHDKTGRELRRMVVNVPTQESNLEALRAADFQQQLVRGQDNPKQTLAAGLFGPHHDQREFWTALLLGALILLLIEPFVANRTSV